MSNVFFISDLHLGHANILNFTDSQGKRVREFESATEMHETIIERCNKVVKPKDRLYILGDVAIKRGAISLLEAMNGRKVLVKGNHDCADKDTECLTQRGWLTYDKLSKDDLVWSVNPNTTRGEWKPIDDIIVKHYSGDMVFLKTERMDMLVTPNHRVALSKNGNVDYCLAKELPAVVRIPTTAGSSNEELCIPDDMVRLLGWVYTDGCINKHKGKPHHITIYQSKPDGCEKLRRIMNNLGLKFSERLAKIKEVGYVICGKPIKSVRQPVVFAISANDSKKVFAHVESNKCTLSKTILHLSDRQFRVFVESVIDGDGSWASNNMKKAAVVYGKSQFIDNMAAACVTHGIQCSTSKFRENDTRLNISLDRDSKMFILPHQSKVGNFGTCHYSGVVWCISTEHTNFTVRRNGKVYITGNCFKLKDYLPYFDDIRGVHVMPSRVGILSHVPLHPDSVDRFKLNIHGHTHDRCLDDSRYFNVSCEVLNYTPISYEEILSKVGLK